MPCNAFSFSLMSHFHGFGSDSEIISASIANAIAM